MIDNFSLGVTHGLLLLTALLLMRRDDLDHEPRPGEASPDDESQAEKRPRWGRRRA